MDQRETQVQRREDAIDSELYEELLNRYERVLVFAGQLQEKANQQKLLSEKNQNLETQNERLKRSLALSESYIRLLEGALQALGVGPWQTESKANADPSESPSSADNPEYSI